VLRTDTGNFNRFLTSLGLLCLIAAFLVPYFYFRDTDILELSKGELRELTPSARDSLEARQHRIGDLELPVVGLSIVSAFAGLGLLVMGGRRLRVAQDKEDAALDRRAKREDYEIEKLSHDEVEKKRDEQAREAADAEAAGAADEEAAVDTGRAAPVYPPAEKDEKPWVALDEDGLETPPSRLRTPRQARVEIARIEERLQGILAGAEFDRFDYQAGVKIVPEPIGPRRPDPSPRQVEVDGLFEAKGRRPDVAMELKITRLNSRSLKGRVRIFTDGILGLLARYNQVTGREVVGWLLILIPRGAPRFTEQERKNVETHFEQALAGLGRCTIVHEDGLELVPLVFQEIFD
jgi:hypothetical protein